MPGARLSPHLISLVVVRALAAGAPAAALADYQSGMPPDIDPGTPTYGGSATPVPPEPAPLDPSYHTWGNRGLATMRVWVPAS